MRIEDEWEAIGGMRTMRHLKKYIWMMSCMLLIFTSGCGNATDTAVTETVTGVSSTVLDEEAGLCTYEVYHINKGWTEFVVSDLTIDRLETTENQIDKMINAMISAEEMGEYQVPVPDGMTYQRYTYDGTGVVTLMFNLDYDTAETYEMLLCKMAFTKTLCQVEDVTRVAFEFTDLLGEREVETTSYTADSFSEIGNDFMESTYEVTIYTPDQTGNRLEKQALSIDALSYKAPEEQIMDALCGSDQWDSPIGDDVDILDIYVQDRICYVNYSAAFLNQVEIYDDKVLLYSVVDSLTELPDVEKVMFSVEGSSELQYGENLDFTQSYGANYSMCN